MTEQEKNLMFTEAYTHISGLTWFGQSAHCIASRVMLQRIYDEGFKAGAINGAMRVAEGIKEALCKQDEIL